MTGERDEEAIEREILGELIGRDATLPWNGVETEEIVRSFPEHEHETVANVLYQLVEEDGPVAWATEGFNIWLEQPDDAEERYETLQRDFPPWFVEED